MRVAHGAGRDQNREAEPDQQQGDADDDPEEPGLAARRAGNLP
ncbi:MAG: hypothetical protein U0R71_06120 [Solirubrobacterales bacterium]